MMLFHPEKKNRAILAIVFGALLLLGAVYMLYQKKDTVEGTQETSAENAALRERLTPLQYAVTQEDGTEPPFKNEYWDHKEEGMYVDIVSGEALFSSIDKYDSNTGWPSFTKPIRAGVVREDTDSLLGYERTEVRSAEADSHLGHIFDDGPIDKGGERYCINSAALRFVAKADMEKEGYGEYLALFQ